MSAITETPYNETSFNARCSDLPDEDLKVMLTKYYIELQTSNGQLYKVKKLTDLEAFNVSSEEVDVDDEFKYDPCQIYGRYGVGKEENCGWRFSNINKEYKFCDTYPAIIIVPSKIDDTTLHFASSFRSKSRVPALTYIHGKNMASMSRSSQPLVGLYNKRSTQDEYLVRLCFTANGKVPYSKLSQSISIKSNGIIIDARPESNIISQKAFGGGTESPSNYNNIKTATLSIPNIHVIQSCLVNHINDILLNDFQLPNDENLKSEWLDKLRIILKGVYKIVESIERHNFNVIVHCSDGWDRTPQLCALSQICLNPYFRTIEGLAVLIEKDWVAFGHQFRTRCGHVSGYYYEKINNSLRQFPKHNKNILGNDKFLKALDVEVKNTSIPYLHRFYEDDVEESNIFTQFLDCLYLIIIRNPELFEYTVDLIVHLHLATYSACHSNFLFISEQEKNFYTKHYSEVYNKKLPNLWDSVLKNKTRFSNKHYSPDSSQTSIIYPDFNNTIHWQNNYFKNKKTIDIFKV